MIAVIIIIITTAFKGPLLSDDQVPLNLMIWNDDCDHNDDDVGWSRLGLGNNKVEWKIHEKMKDLEIFLQLARAQTLTTIQ